MDLSTFKRAAKRLQKLLAEDPAHPGTAQLSHAAALTLLAKSLGYRDFHQAQTHFATVDALAGVQSEPGGLLCISRAEANFARKLLASRNTSFGIVARAGLGKSWLCFELLIQALLDGRRVRVIDEVGSYRHLCQALRGVYLEAPDLKAWQSDNPLVVMNLETVLRTGDPVDFENLVLDNPSNVVLICDEVYQYAKAFRPLATAGVTILVMQDVLDLKGRLTPDYLIEPTGSPQLGRPIEGPPGHARKHNSVVQRVQQTLEDFFDSPEARAALANAAWQLNSPPPRAKNMSAWTIQRHGLNQTGPSDPVQFLMVGSPARTALFRG